MPTPTDLGWDRGVTITRAGPVLLSSGYAPPEAFPGPQLAELAGDILVKRAAEALQYGERFGYQPLRRQIAQWLEQDDVKVSPDEVMVMSGAKQNLDICTRIFCRPGEHVLVSDPTYMNGLSIFKLAGARVMALPGDAEGLDVEALGRLLDTATRTGAPLPKLIYVIPDFNNPSGAVMPEARRAELVALAARYNIPILEDNPYRWTRFEGRAPKPLKHFDTQGIVISTGSFAKILGPGLRLGWVHARKDILDKIGPLKTEGGSSAFVQMLAHAFFQEEGSLAQHLKVITRILHSRRDALLESLAQHLAGRATWSTPEGGYYVWADFADGVNTDMVAKEAGAAGVKCYQGSVFFGRPDPPRHYMRLSYSYETEERIRTGVASLTEVVNRHAS